MSFPTFQTLNSHYVCELVYAKLTPVASPFVINVPVHDVGMFDFPYRFAIEIAPDGTPANVLTLESFNERPVGLMPNSVAIIFIVMEPEEGSAIRHLLFQVLQLCSLIC